MKAMLMPGFFGISDKEGERLCANKRHSDQVVVANECKENAIVEVVDGSTKKEREVETDNNHE
mgnify:CR=1 FL=1